jgi:glycosyltransferase involved in cell wall biosynthesis
MPQKRVLMISPIPTHPRNAGHRERIYQLIRQMQALGHDVHLLHVTLEPGGDLDAMRACWGDRLYLFQHDLTRTPNQCSPSFHGTLTGKIIRNLLFKLGKEVSFPYAIDDWYDPGCEQFLTTLHQHMRFDVVLVEYAFFSKALNVFDCETVKMLDTHDIFSNRHKLFQQHRQQPDWFYTTRHQEKKGLQRADVILAIQEHERRFFAAMVPAKTVVTVGHFVEFCRVPLKSGSPPTLLFFASGNPVNLHGFTWFLKEVLPGIQAHFPQVRLLLAGSVCQAIAEHSAYTKLGEVEETKTAYELADVVISPMLFGTGLKIKNIETLGYAKPLVTTPAGAVGLEQGVDEAFFVAATPEAFVQCVTGLLADDALRREMSDKAYQFASAVQQQNRMRLDQILQFEKTRCLQP